jgi:acid phosphatase
VQKSKMFFTVACFMILSPISGAQVPSQDRTLIPREPTPNLGQLKLQLIAYHDCVHSGACYLSDLNRQSEVAIAYLRRRVAKAEPSEKLALVLDIDETALSNWDEEKRDDFGYIVKDWNEWVDEKKAPAIAGTLHLYNEALEHSVSVFFITGRSNAQEAATSDNLKAAGYHDWTGLSLRGPHPAGQTTVEYKAAERKKIADAGFRIILNVGDQLSDLEGSPQAERSIKLPNPFYYIP